MPRYIDHDLRRDQVAAIAADLVASRGVDALTFRQVAEAAGCSTAIVSHYFTDKRDLLLSTYRTASARSLARFLAVTGTDGQPMQACLETLLPLDDDRRKDWRLWFAFWGIAAFDPELAAEQRERVRTARARIGRVLDDEMGCETGDDNGLDPDESQHTASRLLLLVHGIGTQALFDPDHWTPDRQRRAIRDELTMIGRLRRG